MNATSPSLAALHREIGIPDEYAAARRLTSHEEAPLADLVTIGTNDEGRPIRLTTAAALPVFLARNTTLQGVVDSAGKAGFTWNVEEWRFG